jgi:hypothetical protein
MSKSPELIWTKEKFHENRNLWLGRTPMPSEAAAFGLGWTSAVDRYKEVEKAEADSLEDSCPGAPLQPREVVSDGATGRFRLFVVPVEWIEAAALVTREDLQSRGIGVFPPLLDAPAAVPTSEGPQSPDKNEIGWVNVKDRLPENGPILMSNGNVVDSVYFEVGDTGRWEAWAGDICIWDQSTEGEFFWMPLPEPPNCAAAGSNATTDKQPQQTEQRELEILEEARKIVVRHGGLPTTYSGLTFLIDIRTENGSGESGGKD